jgi:hypothetical protein
VQATFHEQARHRHGLGGMDELRGQQPHGPLETLGAVEEIALTAEGVSVTVAATAMPSAPLALGDAKGPSGRFEEV